MYKGALWMGGSDVTVEKTEAISKTMIGVGFPPG